MRAMDSSVFGESKLVEIPIPKLKKDGDVLIRIEYSVVNRAMDRIMKKTWVGMALHVRTTPLVLGYDFVGIVEEVGKSVSKFTKGMRVCGFLGYSRQILGTYTEKLVVGQDTIAQVPDNVDPKEAVSALTDCVCALLAVRDCANMKDNQKALVIGAGGGIGAFVCPVIKCLYENVHVTSVCSTKDVDRAEKQGADAVIDRKKQEITGKYDAILDTPPAYTYSGMTKFMTPTCSYVFFAPSISNVLFGSIQAFFSSRTCTTVFSVSKTSDLELVMKWIGEGKIKVDVDSEFELEDLEAAYERHRAKDRVGRVVVRVTGGDSGEAKISVS